MPPYGAEPDWATPGDTTTQAPTPSPPVDASGGAVVSESTSSDGGGKIRFVLVMVSLLNFGMAALMAALGVLILLDFSANSLTDIVGTPFLASYMILFALLLFFYELMWWVPIGAINKTLRKNFGFMYGLKGKGLYMIFIAFLCLGLLDEKNDTIKIIGYATGIGFVCVGALHFFLILSNPDFQDYYKPPTAGLERMGASEVANAV